MRTRKDTKMTRSLRVMRLALVLSVAVALILPGSAAAKDKRQLFARSLDWKTAPD